MRIDSTKDYALDGDSMADIQNVMDMLYSAESMTMDQRRDLAKCLDCALSMAIDISNE